MCIRDRIFVTRQIQSGLFTTPVQIFTCSRFTFSSSTPNSNRIVYDYNYALTQIYVQDIPRSIQTTVSAEFEATNNNKKYGFGYTNAVYFNIQPSIITSNGGVFFIEIDPQFEFTGTCISVATSGTNYIEALDEGSYSCEIVSDTPYKIQIIRNDTITKTKFRIKAFILNPYIIAESGFKVYYYQKLNNKPTGQIISIGKDTSSIFYTSSIQITQQSYQLFWGFPHSGSHSQLLKSHVLCVDTCLLYTSPSPRDQA
eukprot:TRINITY_DN35835_c0_g1_i2.p1 TRINITY_DN35835_c0_g1~~TRINITY_DN35835_c0_g1_i2.p1  ORF type:complete len:256 (-),score=32.52 TRINITY_DN35835_c0_g1_i2:126-893(-)